MASLASLVTLVISRLKGAAEYKEAVTKDPSKNGTIVPTRDQEWMDVIQKRFGQLEVWRKLSYK